DHLRRGGAMAKKTATSRRNAGRKRRSPRQSGSSRRAAGAGRRWAQHGTEHSEALTLDKGGFTLRGPKPVAASVKPSAGRSRRRNSSPFRSALSMLTFYINRAGKSLPASRKRTLMRAKDELRKQFGKA